MRHLPSIAAVLAGVVLSACAAPEPPKAPALDPNTPVSERAAGPAGTSTDGTSSYGDAPLNGTVPQAVPAHSATPDLAATAVAGAAPAAQEATGGEAGNLPLPTGYPLLPGDAELWATLTRAQQDRALLFLQDGSTIRSSLRTD